MRILLLSKYDTSAAPTRLRTFQYIPYLNDHGAKVTFSSLTDTDYLHRLYTTGGRSVVGTAAAYFRRLMVLRSAHRYDLLWIEKELFPYLPSTFERLCYWTGIPYIVDYDDAVFHNYDSHDNIVIRKLLARKIDMVMCKAALVITGNQYLADRAQRAGAKRIEIVPTVVDLDRYTPIPENMELPFTIGWIGTPSTAQYLKRIVSALKQLVDGELVRLLLVGSGPIDLGVPTEIVDWSEEKEVKQIHRMSVGIMPLDNTPWELGKCGYKLIQYMACSLPVVAAPVGANNDIVEHGVNGYLAHSIEDWISLLEALMRNPALRRTMGHNGRLKVEKDYCLQVTAPRILQLLSTCVQ